MHINGIGLLNTIYRHIIFATSIMIKNRKVNKTEYGIKQTNKIYFQRGLKITRIYSDIKSEPLHSEIYYLGISLNWLSKKEHVPEIENSIEPPSNASNMNNKPCLSNESQS